jgi:hypothetical protein
MHVDPKRPSAIRRLAPSLETFWTITTGLHATQNDIEGCSSAQWWVVINSRWTQLLTCCTAPRALARHARQSSRPLQRFLSTETDSIEASTENSLKQLQSIEAQLNTHLQQPVPSVDPETHATSESASDNVAQQYHLYKQQCMTSVSPSPTAAR